MIKEDTFKTLFVNFLNDQKGNFTIECIKERTAQNANDAINKLLTPLKHWVKTLTFDNGREFIPSVP
jgi:IS30 family transposase